MSEGIDRCPECNRILVANRRGVLWCIKCESAGTGPSMARAGVSCTTLVGCPALPIRVYRCLTNWKTWRECRKLDAAAQVLWNTELGRDVAIELKALSDARWRHILRHPTTTMSCTAPKEDA